MALIRPRPRVDVRIATEGQRDQTEWQRHEMTFMCEGESFVLTPARYGQGYGAIQQIRITLDDLEEALNEASSG